MKLTYTYAPVLNLNNLLSLPVYLIYGLHEHFKDLEKKYYRLTIDRILVHFIYGLAGQTPPDNEETINLTKQPELLDVLKDLSTTNEQTSADSTKETSKENQNDK